MKGLMFAFAILLLGAVLQVKAGWDYCPDRLPQNCTECKDKCLENDDCPLWNEVCCKGKYGNVCQLGSFFPTSGVPADGPLCKKFCPQNEEFVACKGRCEKDCKNRYSPPCPSCSKFCVSECRCKSGYVRGPKGTCILPNECPNDDPTHYPVERQCPKNEHWGSSAHCQKNCTNMHEDFACAAVVVEGCVCNKGLYRGVDGKCIPESQCPLNLGLIKEWEDSDENENTEISWGFCPKPKDKKPCQHGCEDKCKSDGECPGNLICCQEKCGNRCRKRSPCLTSGIPASGPTCNQWGFCPKKRDIECVWCIDECYFDTDCPKNEVCCQGNCGNVCDKIAQLPPYGTPANGLSSCWFDDLE